MNTVIRMSHRCFLSNCIVRNNQSRTLPQSKPLSNLAKIPLFFSNNEPIKRAKLENGYTHRIVRLYSSSNTPNNPKGSNLPILGAIALVFLALYMYDKTRIAKLAQATDGNGKIHFSKDLKTSDILEISNYFINNRDYERLSALIEKTHGVYFWNTSCDVSYILSSIRDKLIEKRDFDLIRKIFPLFAKYDSEKGSTHSILSIPHTFYALVKNGDEEFIQILCESGVKPYIGNWFSYGMDVLLYALYLDKKEIATYLVKHAKYDINDSFYFSVTWAKDGNSKYSNYDCMTPAYLAAVMNKPELLEFLISLGADPTRYNKNYSGRFSEDNHNNPLIYSIMNGQKECFDVIINSKKELNLEYKGKGTTALIEAIRAKNIYMVETLIAKGAFVDTKMNVSPFEGITPLMVAIDESQENVLEFLIQAGANPHEITDRGLTLWHFAHTENIFKTLKSLKVENRLINFEDENGETALFKAVKKCDVDTVSNLVWGFGADITTKVTYSCKEFNLENNKQNIDLVEFTDLLIKEKMELNKRNSKENFVNYESEIANLKKIRDIFQTIHSIDWNMY